MLFRDSAKPRVPPLSGVHGVPSVHGLTYTPTTALHAIDPPPLPYIVLCVCLCRELACICACAYECLCGRGEGGGGSNSVCVGARET